MKRITVRAGNGRRNTLKQVNKYKFKFIRDQVHLTWFNVDDVSIYELLKFKNFKEFEFERDIEILSQFFSTQLNMLLENVNIPFVGVSYEKTEPYSFLNTEFYTLSFYGKEI